MLLEGLQLPLTTPFYPDGRLNLLKLEHNMDRYSKTPVAGLVVLSESGEVAMLSEAEAGQVMQSAARAAAAEKVLIAGISRESVVGSLRMAEMAAGIGFDALLAGAPSTVSHEGRGVRTRELLTYFQMIADRSPLPVILSDGMLSDEVIEELCVHPQILGIVVHDAKRVEGLFARTATVSRDVTVTSVFAAVTRRMVAQNDESNIISAASLSGGGATAAVAATRVAVKTRTKKVGFQILAGRTAGMLDGLLAGAVGTMPAFAAAAPQACYEVVAAWKDGDEGLAMEKQVRVADVAQRVEGELGVAGVKFGCDLNGYYGGVPRLPVLPLNGAERAEVESLMLGLRN